MVLVFGEVAVFIDTLGIAISGVAGDVTTDAVDGFVVDVECSSCVASSGEGEESGVPCGGASNGQVRVVLSKDVEEIVLGISKVGRVEFRVGGKILW